MIKMKKKYGKWAPTKIYYYFTEAELCSSLNSLNWLVWSPAHYSFSFSVTSYECVDLLVLFIMLTHTQGCFVRDARLFRGTWRSFGLPWLSCCCWMRYVVDEKRYFPQCLTETCNQQLKTSETSIFVVCTNNKLYILYVHFFPSSK